MIHSSILKKVIKLARHGAGLVVWTLIAGVNTGNAQFLTAASYPFKAKLKTFTYLTGGTSVSLQADDITVNVPIGFTFTYCGTGYTSVSPCSNGWMAFGVNSSNQWVNTQANTAAMVPMLMPLWDDLQGVGSTTSYKTTGPAGNRVFTFEWRETRPLSYTTNPEFSMQVLLYEATGAIEFLYKQEVGTNPIPSATIGIFGKTNNDFQVLATPTTNPAVSTTTFNDLIVAKPATGQSYFWGVDCPTKFLAQPQNIQVCASETAMFTATVDSATQYQWQVNGGGGWVNLINDATYAGTTTTTLSVNNTKLSMNNYLYRLIATNVEKACSVDGESAALIMVPSSNSTIIIAAEPDTVICKEELVTFHSAYTNGGASPQYKWLKNGVVIPGETNATLQTKGLAHGDYIQCNFISNGQCVFPSISSGIIFTVKDTIKASVELTVDYHGGNLYTFTAHSANGGLTPKYYWYVNNKIIPGENGVTYSSEDLHPYDKVTVSMLTSRDCAAPKFSTSQQATTSVNKLAEESPYILSPNPNKGSFTITGTDNNSRLARIKISNTIGQVIYQSEFKTEQGRLQHDINMGTATPGIYILYLETDGYQEMKKFTITD